MNRVLTIGAGIGLVVGSAIYFNRFNVPKLFSSDITVQKAASRALTMQAITLVSLTFTSFQYMVNTLYLHLYLEEVRSQDYGLFTVV